MFRISAQSVNAARGLAVWCLRAAAVVLLGFGAFAFLTRVLWHLAQSLVPSLSFYNDGTEIGSPFTGLALIAIGTTLGALAPPIARWMIPVAPESCPRCGYAGSAGEARCPECGLALKDDQPL